MEKKRIFVRCSDSKRFKTDVKLHFMCGNEMQRLSFVMDK